MICRYPAGSEYEYIWWAIQQDYWEANDRELKPFYKAENDAWNGDSDALYEQAHQRRVEAQNCIQQQRWRREEILEWLYLDIQLRQQGTSYPDV